MMNTIQEGEHLPSSDICTYWPANPKWFLLGSIFFINEDKTKYVSAGQSPSF